MIEKKNDKNDKKDRKDRKYQKTDSSILKQYLIYLKPRPESDRLLKDFTEFLSREEFFISLPSTDNHCTVFGFYTKVHLEPKIANEFYRLPTKGQYESTIVDLELFTKKYLALVLQKAPDMDALHCRALENRIDFIRFKYGGEYSEELFRTRYPYCFQNYRPHISPAKVELISKDARTYFNDALSKSKIGFSDLVLAKRNGVLWEIIGQRKLS